LDVLERALEDGVLDPDERTELVELAKHLGLTHERAQQLHRIPLSGFEQATAGLRPTPCQHSARR
jgi:hypothetical protein